MDSEPEERPSAPHEQGRRAADPASRSRPFLVFGIAIAFAASFYLALVVVTRADTVLFPGNGIRVNLPLNIRLPGVDLANENPGVYGERLNILVMGLDRRPWESKDTPVRADSIFVTTIDTINHTAGILAFPRDLWLDIPDGRGGYQQGRINAPYALGTLRGDGSGPRLTKDAIEHNFGIKIDRYVVIDFVGFERLVDALGGVDIEVKDRLYDNDFWLPKRRQSYAYFEPGPLHMDGELALAYVRIRSDSDLKRIQRQQQVLFAMMEKSRSLGIISRAKDLWSEYQDTIETDVKEVELPGLVALVKDMTPDEIMTRSLGDAVRAFTTADGAAVLLLETEKAQALFDEVFYDPRVRQERAVVELRDGKGDPGMLQKVAAYLTAHGFTAGSLITTAASDARPLSDTYIYDLTGKSYTARKLAGWLNVPAQRVRGRDPGIAETAAAAVDVVVVLGSDAKLPSPEGRERTAGLALP